jgi:hypothetical protein
MCRTKKGTIGILTSLENKSYLIEIGKGKSQFHQTLLLSLTLSDQQQHSFPNSSLSLACKFSLSFSSHMNKMKITTWLNSLPLSLARISLPSLGAIHVSILFQEIHIQLTIDLALACALNFQVVTLWI